MARESSETRWNTPGRGRFATTRWSVVLAAGRGQSADARTALESLCGTYWYPLYAYARRWGHSAEEAQDLVQEFFAYLLERESLAAADRERGRFRTFLLTVFQRFTIKQGERERAQKRGAGRPVFSLDASVGEACYRREPCDTMTPEMLYERRWALTLLETVLGRLEKEYADKGKGALFETLRVLLTGESGAESYRELGGKLGLSEGAVKVAVHRLRRRYQERLREEIANTVGSEEEVEDELDHLIRALQSG